MISRTVAANVNTSTYITCKSGDTQILLTDGTLNNKQQAWNSHSIMITTTRKTSKQEKVRYLKTGYYQTNNQHLMCLPTRIRKSEVSNRTNLIFQVQY
jgi:hypothetical protein